MALDGFVISNIVYELNQTILNAKISKIAQPERRLIHVSVARQKNFLRIRIENCFEGDIKFENGMPVTSKTDHRFHGFGTKSICRIAERYGGSMTIDVRENWFELRVLIPL